MFHVSRWAAAFTGVAGDNAEEGLACLKALVQAVKSAPGGMFGYAAARRLEKALRESASAVNAGAEYAIRFITLLVEKNGFRHIDTVMQKIEKIIDGWNGILEVTVESVSLPDDALAEELSRQIAARTGAAGIKMNRRAVPELLGGYRLRIGGFYVDASLKGQAEKLTAELTNEK
jgi:F-type H+-transporting ATPase subunit delta